jgi:DNA polymerase III epsilon subunit-like protein
MTFFFDTETTGLPQKSFFRGKSKYNYRNFNTFNSARIVSVAWIVTGNGPLQKRNFIIRPEGFEIPEAATNIHGISTEHALANGVSFATMAVQLLDDLQVSSVELVVAHNIIFDKAVMKSELFRRGNKALLAALKATKKYCTMLNAQTILRLMKWPRLPDLYTQLTGKTPDPAALHTATGDVLYCYECYQVLVEKF